MREEKLVEKQVKRVETGYGPPTCDFCEYVDVDEDEVFSIRVESGIDTCGHERVTRDICHQCYAKIEKLWDTLHAFLRSTETLDLREYHEDI